MRVHLLYHIILLWNISPKIDYYIVLGCAFSSILSMTQVVCIKFMKQINKELEKIK